VPYSTVIPSECYEGQPYGALESMAVGTPVVASCLGGLAEIIEDGITGNLVPPGNPSALAVAMREMWVDKGQAAKMGEQAWSYARASTLPPRRSWGGSARFTSSFSHRRDETAAEAVPPRSESQSSRQ